MRVDVEPTRNIIAQAARDTVLEKGLGHGCANHATEGKRYSLPIHCCDVMKPPYLLSGELCTSPFHSKRLSVYTVCYRRGGQFSVLGTRKSDVILTYWATVVGEVTSPSSDTMCPLAHPCAIAFAGRRR